MPGTPRLKRMPLMFAVMALVVLALNAPAFAAGGIPPEPEGNHVPVTICHDVNGNGNTDNGYNIETLDASSIVRRGHTAHGGGLVDIIPPFTYWTLEGKGQNRFWQEHQFRGQGDASLIADNCGSSGPPPEPCPGGDFNGADPGCGEPAVDVCPNIDGEQAEVPPGMEVDENGLCVPVVLPGDMCPNIDGDQADVPPGMEVDEDGDCVEAGSGSAPSPGTTVLGEQATTGGPGTPVGKVGAQGAVSSNAPAVPTDVDAGLAPTSTGSGKPLMAHGLVAFGFVLIACAGLLALGPRRRGAYPA